MNLLDKLINKHMKSTYIEGVGTVEGRRELECFANDLIHESLQLLQTLVDHREPASTYVAQLRDHWYSTPQNQFDEILKQRCEALAKAKVGTGVNQWWITPNPQLNNQKPCTLDIKLVYKHLINLE